jgi:hypothetical protein
MNVRPHAVDSFSAIPEGCIAMRALPRVVSFLCRQLPACRAVVAAILCTACALSRAAEPERLAVLMLGDKGHHRPAVLADLLSKYCSARKIDVT